MPGTRNDLRQGALPLVALVIFGGGVLGYHWPHPAEASAGGASVRPESNLCTGGVSPPLSAKLEPAKIVRDHDQESIVLKLHLRTKFKGSARIKYALELLSDRGEALADPVTSEVLPVDQKEAALELPPIILPTDGYYNAKVTVVAKTDQKEQYGEVMNFRWQMSQGKVVLIDEASWMRQSAYGASTAHLESATTPGASTVPHGARQ